MNSKISHLEGLRGLAALVVVIAHYLQFYYLDSFFTNPNSELELVLSKTPLNLIYNANLSVCIFFVLSGYVLSMRFFKEQKFDILQSGAGRRYFRLAIPVFFSVIISYLLLITNSYESFTNLTGDLRYDNMSKNFIDMIKITFFDVFFNYSNTYNTVLWTMTYELFGSFLVFAFLALFGTMKKRYLVYILLFTIFIDSYYLSFIVGMALSDIHHSNKKDRFKLLSNKLFTTIVLIFGLYLGSYPYFETKNTIYQILNFNFLTLNYSVFYHIIGALLIIVSIFNSMIITNFLTLSILKYLGKISFSLYLIHFPILATFSFKIFQYVRNYYDYNTSFIIVLIISTMLTFICSHLFAKYIDDTSIVISKKIFNTYLKP